MKAVDQGSSKSSAENRSLGDEGTTVIWQRECWSTSGETSSILIFICTKVQNVTRAKRGGENRSSLALTQT